MIESMEKLRTVPLIGGIGSNIISQVARTISGI